MNDTEVNETFLLTDSVPYFGGSMFRTIQTVTMYRVFNNEGPELFAYISG
jgi:hypothetical protein